MAQRKIILLVDDNLAIATCYRKALDTEGFDTLVASNAEEAFRILGEVETPRLILVDYCFPKTSGAEIIKRLKSHYPKVNSIPTWVFSSLPDNSPAAQSVRAAGERFMEKPYDIDELVETVKRLAA